MTFRDGLGVREWRDTAAGERVEWFHLDPCFASVEMPLRDRVTRLAKLQHVKFARILSMEPARSGAGPVLVSSHVPGTRFSEVLDMAAHGLVTVEPATAVQIIREVVGALVVLHDSRSVTHGALGPERLVLTASGRVVVAEHALAAALERLNLPRHQLWRDWRVATPPTPGSMRFDVRTDLAQLGLLGLGALLGRSIEEEEYPHRLRGLLPLAQDKLARSPLAAIASDLVAWLERLVPVESRRAFTTVKEAQQAFEAFVSARATSMIIAPARVKGLMSAVTALLASAAPTAVAVDPVDVAPPAQALPVLVTSEPVSPAAPSSVEPAALAPVEGTPAASDGIDIDALLRLEAELEGGEVSPVEAPVVQTTVSAPEALPVPAQSDSPSTLEALEHERRDLARQFAAIVAAVAPEAPAAEAPAVRLRPETPDTVDTPLVDALVRWSSMPAADLPETPDDQEEQGASSGVGGDAPGDGADASSQETLAFAFEPMVVAVPDLTPPGAALDHVPTAWWREALPWRDDARQASDPVVDTIGATDTPVLPSEDDRTVEPIAAEPISEVASQVDASRTDDALTLPPAGDISVEDVGIQVEPTSDEVSVVDADEAGPGTGDPEVSATSGQADSAVVAIGEPVPDDVGDARLFELPAALFIDTGASEGSSLEVVVDVDPAPVAITDDLVSREPLTAEVPSDPGSVEADEAQLVVDVAVEPPDALWVDAARVDVVDAEPQPRSSLFGEFTDLRLQHDEAGGTLEEAMPSLRPTFAFLQDDHATPTAAASLLARPDDAAAIAQESWRTVFENTAPAQPLLGIETVVAPAWTVDQVSGEATQAATPIVLAEGEMPDDVAAVPESTAFFAFSPAPLMSDTDAPAPPPEPVAEPVPEAEPITEVEPVTEVGPEPVAEVEPVTEVGPGPVPEVAPVAEVEREPVPEVVIVDAGDDACAFDALTPEMSSTPAAVEVVDERSSHAGTVTVDPGLASDDQVDTSDDLDASHEIAAATTSTKKKRRRSRRKKATAATSPAPLVAPVAVPLEVVPAVPLVSVPAMTPIAPSFPMGAGRFPEEASDFSDETPLGGRQSLLQREVPAWTPPVGLASMGRAVAPRPSPASAPEPAAAVVDQRQGDTMPGATVVAGNAALPRDVSPVPTAFASPAPQRTRQAMTVPVEPPRAEEAIRAVGMPDLEELGLSSGRVALTSMADATGPLHAPARTPEPRPGIAAHAAPDDRSRWKWRRLIAASVLIAVFNGAAFAAWWWVQPGAAGTLVVQTAQPGVEVLLDGKVLGKTPFKDQVAPGRHKLTLRQGTSVREMPVEISLGVVTTQSVDWPAADASARGNLQVSSTPAGAEILIDGKSMGKAPQLLEDLPAGNLAMTLRGDAGTVTVTATVIAGETTPLDVPIFAGWVVFDAPIELNVVLRGARIGANTDGQILLSPGRHELQAVNEALGFRKGFTVLVEPGEVRRVAVTVPPAPLQVQDEPGSEVFVDGERVGVLPGALRIPLGTHDVLVRRPDQSERRQTVTVRAGDTVSM